MPDIIGQLEMFGILCNNYFLHLQSPLILCYMKRLIDFPLTGRNISQAKNNIHKQFDGPIFFLLRLQIEICFYNTIHHSYIIFRRDNAIPLI